MRILKAVASVSLAALMALTAGEGTAGAQGRHKVNFDGSGTYFTADDGTAHLEGDAAGAPFDGTYSATLAAADGTLPAAGSCEPATAWLRLDGARGRFLELTSTATVCGQHLQPPFVVTHIFSSRYSVVASSKRNLVGTDGFFEIRLAVDGRSSVFAIDTD